MIGGRKNGMTSACSEEPKGTWSYHGRNTGNVDVKRSRLCVY